MKQLVDGFLRDGRPEDRVHEVGARTPIGYRCMGHAASDVFVWLASAFVFAGIVGGERRIVAPSVPPFRAVSFSVPIARP